MKIFLLAARAAPLSEARQPGTVVDGLAQALAAAGHDVRVALPKPGLAGQARLRPRPLARFYVPHVGGDQIARVSTVQPRGLIYYLIDAPPIPRSRPVRDDHWTVDEPQAIFSSLAALGLCRALEWAPDVVHAVDAAGSPAVYWLATDGRHDSLFANTATVFTFQGLTGNHADVKSDLQQYGLTGSDSPLLSDSARGTLLGLGLAHADMLHTLRSSRGAAVLGLEYADGLGGLFQARRERLVGFLNGLDERAWDPRHDPHIAARYDADHPEKRAANKRALQKEMDLPAQARTPLIVVLPGREAGRGLGLALPALRQALSQAEPLQWVVVGQRTTGSAAELRALVREWPQQVRVRARADRGLLSRLYAGADLLLAPGHDEDSVLSVLIALRYGAVPLVSGSAGSAAAVVDAAASRRGTGFVFTDYNAGALLAAVQRALTVYRRPAAWGVLQRRGLQRSQRFTWTRSAEAYLALYQQAIAFRKESVTKLAPTPLDDLVRLGAVGVGGKTDGLPWRPMP